MKSKNLFVLLLSLFFIPISIFSQCYFASDNQAYFNENTYSSFRVMGRGECPYTDSSNSSCNQIKYTGTLPTGLDYRSRGGTLIISGTPEQGTEGDYKVYLTIGTSLGGCSEGQNLTVTVLSEVTPWPVERLMGVQISKQEKSLNHLGITAPEGLTIPRAKNKLSINNYKNLISWKAPRGGPTVAAFRIYRDKDLTQLVKQISIHKKGRYEYVIPNRSPNRNYTYYIVSVSDEGVISPSVHVKIKGDNKSKGNKKKQHQGCMCK